MLFSENNRPMYRYLTVLTFAQAASFLGWHSVYTNFAVEVAGLNGQQNGIVQSVREVPGLLSVGVVFLLFYLKEITLTSLTIIVCGVGVILSGFFPSFNGLIICTLLLSFGFHYFEATNQSLTLQYFSTLEAPLIIGRLRAMTALGSFIMGGLILLMAWLSVDYIVMFSVAGSVALAAGVWSFFQKPEMKGLPVQRRGMVIKSKYWLFYVLTALSGARRQIFSVFAIFFLVNKFDFTVLDVSLLFLLNNLINWFLNPYIGHIINRFGERKLLTGKYIWVTLICLAYVFCQNAAFAAILYVLDQISFCFTISLRTFFQKIGEKEDIAPTMAVGVTFNHVAAVAVPFIGGLLWMIDYRITFLMGVLFSLTSLIMTQFIKVKP